jgi:hypothetical protein
MIKSADLAPAAVQLAANPAAWEKRDGKEYTMENDALNRMATEYASSV